MTTLTWEEFENKYKPVQNHVTKREEFNGWLFETYDDDLQYVKTFAAQHPNQVWTILECGHLVIANGLHFVNRFGYVITKVPFDAGAQIEVVDQEDIDQLSEED